MKDFSGQEFQEGQLVVCKPKSEYTWNGMRFGFIKKVNDCTIRVVTFCKQYWSDKHAELREGNYTDIAAYVLPSEYPLGHPQTFPEGFPKELKDAYYEQFPRNPS